MQAGRRRAEGHEGLCVLADRAGRASYHVPAPLGQAECGCRYAHRRTWCHGRSPAFLSTWYARVLRDLIMPVAMRLLASPETFAWQFDHPIDWAAPVTAPRGAALPS